MKVAEAREFLAELLELGFGRMKPSHYEPYLFHKLRNLGYFADKKGTYEEAVAMMRLKLDVKRLRKLKADADRLFGISESTNAWHELQKIIRHNQFDFHSGEVRLQITDTTIRDAIEFELMNHGVILDYSFSKNLLRLPLQTFLRFVEKQSGKKRLPDEFLEKLRDAKNVETVQAIDRVSKVETYARKDAWDKIESITRALKNVTSAGKDIASIILGLSVFQ